MSAVDSAAPPVKPAHGEHCPICNVGILFRIAETEEGEYLACFNCDTRGTVHKTEEWQPVRAIEDSGTPTGFQLAPEQLAAKREAGIDPAALGKPSASTQPQSAPTTEVEQHETHDVVPPAEGQ